MIRAATIEGRYRYDLTRRWSRGSRLCWIMLNPSTADADTDDPTIRRCIGLSRGWGYAALTVVNLFALRSTDPRALRDAIDPIGPRNDRYVKRAASRCAAVVAAWGGHGALHGRDQSVLDLLGDRDIRVVGCNRDGSPRHPLYVRADARALPWENHS